jgi:thiol-disulfide isomerase/thioredoxin
MFVRRLTALALSAMSLLGCDAGAIKDRVPPAAAAEPPRPIAPQAPAAAQAPPPPEAPAAAAGPWGGTSIQWRTSNEAFAEAKRTNKPIALVVFTTWCPHCKRFQRVFDDPRIVEASKSFVMVHVDGDADRDLADRYAPDGGYFPRTMFLKPDASLLNGVRAKDEGRFQFFYDENDASPLLAAMDKAKREVVR